MNTALFYFSLLILVLNVLYFVHRVFIDPSRFIETPQQSFFHDFMFAYQKGSVYISLFLMNLYVVITSRVLSNAFAKTQGSEAAFMFCFLIACLAETSRFYIPMFSIQNSFTEFLIFLGRISVFARILAPLSLLFSVIMVGPDQRQNLERNMGLIIVASMFVALVLPLNTAIIERDFRVHAGFDKIIVSIEVIIDCLAVFSLFLRNYNEKQNQKSTLGLIFVIAGFVLNINSYTYFLLVLSETFTIAGTVLYLKEIHDRNLYE